MVSNPSLQVMYGMCWFCHICFWRRGGAFVPKIDTMYVCCGFSQTLRESGVTFRQPGMSGDESGDALLDNPQVGMDRTSFNFLLNQYGLYFTNGFGIPLFILSPHV